MFEKDELQAKPSKRALMAEKIAGDCRCVSSQQALERELKDFVPDLLLLDSDTRNLEGASALQFVTQNHPEIPIIIMGGGCGETSRSLTQKQKLTNQVPRVFPERLSFAVRLILQEEREKRKRATSKRELESKLILLELQHESSPDGILVVDEFAKVVSRNEHFLDMWRVPAHLRHSVDDPGMLEFAKNSVKDPKAFLAKIIYLYAHPGETSRDEIDLSDGRTFDRYTTPMVDSEGVYLGRVWFFRDVTEQKAAEHQLRLFRSMIDRSSDTVQVIDSETLDILDVNETACLDLGYSREELLQKRIPEIAPETNPDFYSVKASGIGKGHL